MFDRTIAFLMGNRDVGGGDVVLKIDERLAGAQHWGLPYRANRLRPVLKRDGDAVWAFSGATAGMLRRTLSRFDALSDRFAEAERAGDRAGVKLPWRRVARNEARANRIKARLDPAMRGKVHDRRPAARHA
jgi:hypothetical protein